MLKSFIDSVKNLYKEYQNKISSQISNENNAKWSNFFKEKLGDQKYYFPDYAN
jgi:hypothetical protein